MSKKNQNKLAINILNLLRLENNFKKHKNIPIPLNKFKSSFSSSNLFLYHNKNQKNTNKNNQTKNLISKNFILNNKTNHIHSNKSIDIFKPKKDISKGNNVKKKSRQNNNFNKININNNPNINTKIGQNTIDHFVNQSNSIKKKRYSSSVHKQRKKIMNDIYTKNHNKEKEINCLKLSSNNTNSTCINTNYTNNFNSKNNKYKNTFSANIEEIQKENKKLISNIEIVGKENKNLNKKINKLRNKNLELRNILYSLKKEKDEYSQSISQSLKLLKLLKKNGLELSEIIENLSNSDSENEEDDNEELNFIKDYNVEDDKEIMSFVGNNNIGCFSESNKNDKNEESEYTDVSYGRLECHEEFSIKKIPKGLKHIPKLKIFNINKENIE